VRIGIDCRIAHYTQGGTGAYTRRLVQAIAGSRAAAGDHLLLLEAARSSRPLLGAPPANVRRARLFTPSHHRWEQLLLPLELLPRGMDVLHSTDCIPPFARRRCHSVITVHDLAFLLWPELLTEDSRAYFNGHIQRAVRSADAIVAVSQATKRDLVELLGVPTEMITVIYEAAGFDLQPLDKPEVEEWLRQHQLPSEYVLFVGTFEPRKNLPRLIEAFADVKRRGYAGKLVLAGSPGWHAAATLEAVRQHAIDVITTPISPASLPYLYGGARLLAFPSIYEGFGLPVLEAMACGTPVLTSNVSSLPEIAGDAALLVDSSETGAIAEGLWQIIQDEDLARELSRKGLTRQAEFSWERAAAQTLDVYHRLS
jgi:glycosyltransferase involved in cell wall biosynthesis